MMMRRHFGSFLRNRFSSSSLCNDNVSCRFKSTLWNTIVKNNEKMDLPSHNEIEETAITSEGEPLSSNDEFCTDFINRNPRNLEQMRYGYKPNGWFLEDKHIKFWHRAIIEKNSKAIKISLVHFSGAEVVSASSDEWAIRKHLYSSKDNSAVENTSRVFARRCLESGFSHVSVKFSDKEMESPKIKIFFKALEEEGLITEEPPQYFPPKPFSYIRVPKPPHYKA